MEGKNIVQSVVAELTVDYVQDFIQKVTLLAQVAVV